MPYVTGMDRRIFIDGPALLFGGPYSNLPATRAVLAEAQRRQIPPRNIVCTGDVVAYGADAKATVELVRAAGIHVIMGNCEESLAEGHADCGCGFIPGSACDRLSAAWYAHAGTQLGPEDRSWMASLPRRLDLELGGLRLVVVHGSLTEINRFVFASTPDRVKALDLFLAEADGIVAGHCGLPFSQTIGGRLWHNPGAIGMPANDGTSRVWFGLLTPGPEPRSLTIEHVALSYAHEAAAAGMRAAGLPDAYAEALSTGLWPSGDVLPPTELKRKGKPLAPRSLRWSPNEPEHGDAALAWPAPASPARLDPQKFRDPAVTATGERRAHVALERLSTLWFNTGTLCNLACANCYIESTPRNDRLVYLSAEEVRTFLDEIERDRLGTELIGFTGGEPFMNPDLSAMLDDTLSRGFRALVLTNAMKPMRRFEGSLLELRNRYPDRLTLRVSVDHYTQQIHELERGPRSWQPTIAGLQWLAAHGFRINVAARLLSGESESILRAGYGRLFAGLGLTLDPWDPVELVVFPEMDNADVPEITQACWGILGKSPADVMCASSRMVVKRKGAVHPAVLACTLLAYDEAFELGPTLRKATQPVALNHPHCARFCVLGGAACSRA
jgi:predicted phosphodiesterase/uncharacterized Fe-S cluster-containing radical SAM superfamily protein